MSQSVCHTKRVERSTDRNLPPIFTKLATKVESQEICLLYTSDAADEEDSVDLGGRRIIKKKKKKKK